MTERSTLLSSIAKTTADYREGDISAPTPEHVDRWVGQFDAGVQLPILREMNHVLKRTYFSRKAVQRFLDGLFEAKALAGDDPCSFWKDVELLDIQGGGASQSELVILFTRLLAKRCGSGVTGKPARPKAFLYLDDAIFTGNRIGSDLCSWIVKSAPTVTNLHIATVALHTGGQYYANKRIGAAAVEAVKDIKRAWWRAIALEDRKAYTDSSDVLRPVVLPDDPDIAKYVETLSYKPQLRAAGQVGANSLYSSDTARQLLEQEFLKAGVRIRKSSPYLNRYQRPLGNMVLETLGFGSLIVTFRNCPNNAPLALWAGDPWYPLFPRSTNRDTALKRLLAVLDKEDS